MLESFLHVVNQLFHYYFLYVGCVLSTVVLPLYYLMIGLWKCTVYLDKNYPYVLYGILCILFLIFMWSANTYEKGIPFLRKMVKKIFRGYVFIIILPVWIWYYLFKIIFRLNKTEEQRLDDLYDQHK